MHTHFLQRGPRTGAPGDRFSQDDVPANRQNSISPGEESSILTAGSHRAGFR